MREYLITTFANVNYRNIIKCVICVLSTMASGIVVAQEISIPSATTVTIAPLQMDTLETLERRIDSTRQVLNIRIDSLCNLNLPSVEYASALNRLYGSFQDKTLSKFRLDSVSQRFAHLDSLVSTKREFLDSLLQAGGTERVTPEFLNQELDPKLPVLGLPQAGLPQINTGIDTNLSLTSLDKLTGVDIPNVQVKGIDELEDVGEIANQAGQITGEAGELTGEIDKVKNGEYSKDLDSKVEEQVKQIDQVQAISKETQAADELKKKADMGKDLNEEPDGLKEKAKEEFVDHFAGKEDMVKKDLDNIGKLQIKYRNVADSRFLPKRPQNVMKGKPFIERLMPGVMIQIFNQNNVSFDLAPFIGYKFSGRLVSGVSGYRRLTYFAKDDVLKAVDCYGFRLFGTFRVIKNFGVYSEIEKINNSTGLPTQAVTQESLWKWNLGVHQRYKISKGLFGHFTLMYDVIQIIHFPNTVHSSVRFGFDYQLKKKRKKNKA